MGFSSNKFMLWRKSYKSQTRCHYSYVYFPHSTTFVFAEADLHLSIINTSIPLTGFVREYSHEIVVDILLTHLLGATVPVNQTGGNFNVTLYLGLSSDQNSTLIPFETPINWTLLTNESLSVSETLRIIMQAAVKIPMAQCQFVSRLCVTIATASPQFYVELNLHTNMACFNISTVCRPSKFIHKCSASYVCYLAVYIIEY